MLLPSLIFGSGNANGSFTVDQGEGVELGLRGKLRFDANDDPQNIFNNNNTNTYGFSAGTPPTGYDFAPKAKTPIWNFEWSINTDHTRGPGDPPTTNSSRTLDDLTYRMDLDFDPGAGENFFSFDPINDGPGDHAFGDHNTGPGGGTKGSKTDVPGYANLIASNSVAQNSWNYVFFDGFGPVAFDPFNPGTYTIRLSAFDGNSELASTSINILVTPVPVPAGLPLLGSVIGFFGFMSWRRKRLQSVPA